MHPLFYTDTDYSLRLMADVDDFFDDEVTSEDVANMLDEITDMFSHRKPLAD